MIYLELFYRFFLTGLFSIGGGLATLPFLYEMMEETGWFTMADVSNMIAVSESTPGPLGVNMATYVGNITAGISGGIVATVGLIAPSIIVIILISKVLAKFRDSKTVQAIFYGLRPASMAMIASAGLLVAYQVFINADAVAAFSGWADLSGIFDFKMLFFAALLWILMGKFKLHPIAFILLAAVFGIVFQM